MDACIEICCALAMYDCIKDCRCDSNCCNNEKNIPEKFETYKKPPYHVMVDDIEFKKSLIDNQTLSRWMKE